MYFQVRLARSILTCLKAGIVTFGSFFVLKETFHPIILERRAARLRKETGDLAYRSRLQQSGSSKDIFIRAIVRPFKLLFLSPICSIFSIYLAIIYGYLYLLFTTISPIYIQQYHWAEDISGLSFLGIGLGMFSGLILFGIMSKRIVKAHEGQPHKPEWRFVILLSDVEYMADCRARLPPMIPGAFAIPAGLFIYGWGAQEKVQWIVPLIGTSLVGFGLICTFMPISTYLVDTFLIYAASATAANTILRSLLGALLPLAGGKMCTSAIASEIIPNRLTST
jgi:MFS family permease